LERFLRAAARLAVTGSDEIVISPPRSRLPAGNLKLASWLVATFGYGAVSWLALALVGWRRRRSLSLLFVGFLALDIAGLAALSALAPVIWGPTRCV